MGIRFDKFGPGMGDYYPRYVVDARYVGRCYLCIHNQGELTDKHKHHSLFIDVAGESRANAKGEIDKIHGFMLHVTAISTGKTEFRHGKASISTKEDLVYFVGQLINNQYRTPGQWASHLRDVSEEIYLDLVENNNDKEQWTANLNCQLFIQKLMELLHLNYPSNILICSDLPPTLVDISILALRSSARSREKLRHQRSRSSNVRDDRSD